ncbi:MAG TPA: shikimate kinase [Acidobacteriaceae bacterium]|jgi:shikimate kinase
MTAAATILEMPTTHKQRSKQPQAQARVTVERVVLTGFMGSGKSTVGAQLAEKLGWEFLDLDSEIERRCGLTVPAIFAELGETHFRKQEAAALASILGRKHVVIALGGGAPETLGNRLLLEQTPATAVVFLEAPFAVLLGRCEEQAAQPDATARPVLADRDQAQARFNTRQRFYERIANLRLDTASLTPEGTVQTLLDRLRKRT